MSLKCSVPWPFPDNFETSKLYFIRSKLTFICVGGISKVVLTLLNDVKLHNMKILRHAVENRKPGSPLITASNHHSCIDDPLLWGLMKWKYLCAPGRIRWTLAAHDVCFRKQWHATFFSLGQCIPVIRGNGVYQRAVDFIIDRLNNGGWAHMFPEGKVNASHEQMRLKWGIGRMVDECHHTPIVIPFWHCGLDDILPNETPYRLHMNKKVTICIGDPIDMSKNLVELRHSKASAEERRKYITDTIQHEFRTLQHRTEELHMSR